jgi:enamine deaminase RidA (YjgF/YER057c/UK114 family)
VLAGQTGGDEKGDYAPDLSAQVRIGAAWKETLGRNFPPSTLLYIDGLVDVRAKVEIEVTAFIPKVA